MKRSIQNDKTVNSKVPGSLIRVSVESGEARIVPEGMPLWYEPNESGGFEPRATSYEFRGINCESRVESSGHRTTISHLRSFFIQRFQVPWEKLTTCSLRLAVTLKISTLFLLFFHSANGQEHFSDTAFLSSDDLIDIALSDAPDVELANIQYSIASLEYDRFETLLKPTLSLNARLPTLNRSIDAITRDDGTQGFINRSYMDNSVSASLRYQLASTGGYISVSSSLQRLDQFATDTYDYRKSYTFIPINFEFVQPLFQFNSLKWQKEILERQEDRTDAQRVLQQENVVYQVVNQFYDLELSRRRLEMTRNRINDSRDLLVIKQKLFERGSGSLANMKQLTLDTLQNGIEYRSLLLEYENMSRSLSDLAGLDRGIYLMPVSPEKIGLPDINIDIAIEQAINNRARTADIRLRMAQAERDIDEAEKDRGVSMDITAQLGANNRAEEFSGLRNGFEDRELISVGLSMPITDWGRRDINRQLADQQLRQLQMNLEAEERDISRQVIELYRQYQYLREKMNVDRTAMNTAEEIYELVRDQYLRGQADWNNLSQNRSTLDNTTLTYFQTRATAVKIYYQLRSITLYDFEGNQPLFIEE